MTAPAVLAASVHNGWAELVVVGRGPDGEPRLLLRERAVLVDPGLPDNPYHHEGLTWPLADAEALVARVRASVRRRAAAALLEARVRAPFDAVVVEASLYESLPDALADVLASWPLTCAADGMMYRETVVACASELGLAVVRFARKVDVVAAVAAALGRERRLVEAVLVGLGAQVGPPWRKEHRLAAAAAWLVLARSGA